MTTANIPSGITIDWGIAHRKSNGSLIFQERKIQPPSCSNIPCLLRYVLERRFEVLRAKYIYFQTAPYVFKRRDNPNLPERYRTGEGLKHSLLREVLVLKFKTLGDRQWHKRKV
jgi:hypothetical protein